MLTGCADLFPKSGQNAENPPATVPYDPTGETVSVIPEEWNVTVPETQDLSGIESLSMVVTEDTIRELDNYPNLRTLDLSGSTCYDTILEYMDAHPGVEVIYTVDLGGTTVSNQATSVRLEAGKYTYEALLEGLKYLPNLTSVSISAVNLTAEQVETLRSTYPDIPLEYTVSLLGQDISTDTATLTLPLLTDEQVTEACGKLGVLTGLTDVTLSNDQSL